MITSVCAKRALNIMVAFNLCSGPNLLRKAGPLFWRRAYHDCYRSRLAAQSSSGQIAIGCPKVLLLIKNGASRLWISTSRYDVPTAYFNVQCNQGIALVLSYP